MWSQRILQLVKLIWCCKWCLIFFIYHEEIIYFQLVMNYVIIIIFIIFIFSNFKIWIKILIVIVIIKKILKLILKILTIFLWFTLESSKVFLNDHFVFKVVSCRFWIILLFLNTYAIFIFMCINNLKFLLL